MDLPGARIWGGARIVGVSGRGPRVGSFDDWTLDSYARSVGEFDCVQWAGRDLRHVALRGASLCGVNLVGCRLDDADLRGADLWGANLAMVSARRIDLRGARLANSSFAGADLRAAQLQGADLSSCDLEGAHLACVDWGRERSDLQHRLASTLGFPSFADALYVHPAIVSRMKAGNGLLAVDAALDVSKDVEGEITALLGQNWRMHAIGAMAIVRRGHASDTMVELLKEHVGAGHTGALPVVALISIGHTKASILSRYPWLAVPGSAGPYRGSGTWVKVVQDRLSAIEAWPPLDEQPAPYRGS